MEDNKEMTTVVEMYEDGTQETYEVPTSDLTYPQYPATPSSESGSVLPVVAVAVAGTAAVIGAAVWAKGKLKNWKAERDEFKAWKESRILDEEEPDEVYEDENPETEGTGDQDEKTKK